MAHLVEHKRWPTW